MPSALRPSRWPIVKSQGPGTATLASSAASLDFTAITGSVQISGIQGVAGWILTTTMASTHERSVSISMICIPIKKS